MEALSRHDLGECEMSYNGVVDVLNVWLTHGPRSVRTRADDDGFIWKIDRYTNKIVGFTIQDFKFCWLGKKGELSRRLLQGLHSTSDKVHKIVDELDKHLLSQNSERCQ
jgi:hypothetical protein